MTYFFGAAVSLILGLYLYGMYRSGNVAALMSILRVIIGGGALLVAAILGLGGRVGPAGVLAALGASVLLQGRLGPIDLRTTQTQGTATSSVKSHFIAMQLDHETGDMWGKIVSGAQQGTDLIDLDEDASRRLYEEISSDPDSLSLFETWLDKYRDGWRDYFGNQSANNASGSSNPGSAIGSMAEAYAILGLKPGASEKDINAAHRRMMKSVHPDQGGSTYLAAKVNEAKDMLLSAKG